MKHVDTIILVEDIEISKKFYMDVMGLEILHDWGNMVIFKDRFSIHKSDALLPENETKKLFSREKQGKNNVILYFEVDGLEAEYQKLVERGIRIVHGIVELPWQKIFRIYDPDNHIIEIGNPF